MLGSYGLLGIFVYHEHTAGPKPTHPCLFWVPVLLSMDCVKINGDIHTDQEEAGGCGSSSLPGGPFAIISQNTSNKTGMKSVPRSLYSFWLKHYFFVMFSFVHDFDKYQCCFCTLKGFFFFVFMQAVSPFFIRFIPHTFFCIKQIQLFLYFLFLW